MNLQSGLSYRYKGLTETLMWPFGQKKKSGSPIPTKPTPSPTPTQIDEDVQAKERARRRQRITAAGRAGTILTEQTGPTLGGASLLGRSS